MGPDFTKLWFMRPYLFTINLANAWGILLRGVKNYPPLLLGNTKGPDSTMVGTNRVRAGVFQRLNPVVAAYYALALAERDDPMNSKIALAFNGGEPTNRSSSGHTKRLIDPPFNPYPIERILSGP
ncbi:unnamed protein product [Dovyalis caffra]|uniref:Uncharacterized protein n=1 Tax=Dovyalis caffra TaxID=77055 RepID=A0AAV1RS18_9ROSI|nr:unnamed protein product [Dovyalis caffra]